MFDMTGTVAIVSYVAVFSRALLRTHFNVSLCI